MIVVTIQGIDDGGKHITAVDGKLVIGDEQQKIIDDVYNQLKHFNIEEDKKIQKNKKDHFFTMEHEIKDIAGRNRKALIFWDQYATDSIIKDTLDIIGLDYEQMRVKIEEAKRYEVKKQKIIISSIIVGLTSLVSGFLLCKNLNSHKLNILLMGFSKELIFDFLKESDDKIIDLTDVKKLVLYYDTNTINLLINKTSNDNFKSLTNFEYTKICYVFDAKKDNLDDVFYDIDKLLKYDVQLSFLCIIDNSVSEQNKKLIEYKISNYNYMFFSNLTESYKIEILNFLVK